MKYRKSRPAGGHASAHRFDPKNRERLDSPVRRELLPPGKILGDIGLDVIRPGELNEHRYLMLCEKRRTG
ncbi:MAG TPA: hypothetical protein PKO25_14780 [Spirochaetota bacterium]|nr:hypothetical protein [Spirochaetota bacterium]HNU93135.1 hypothetical protein [Spirochaetota bacterium]HPV98233.1 hypothetical protein [Spirochaetota bacterium]